MFRIDQTAMRAVAFSRMTAPGVSPRLPLATTPVARAVAFSHRATPPSPRLLLAVALLATTLLAATLNQRARAAGVEVPGTTFPASVSAAGVFADTGTFGLSPSISDDGRYVAFASTAGNIGGEGPAGIGEVYVKDLDTGDIQLVSRADGSSGEAANAPAGEGIEKGVISGNGRYVIFTSDASNLATGLPGEELEERHVYRRDLHTGETQLIDRVTGGEGAILNREARAEAISDDGRYVVFSDHVSDLDDPIGAHEGGERMVYVRDMSTDTTTLVSRASGVSGAVADARSSARSISPDGRYVAFVSSADNLVEGTAGNAISQVYLRDMELHTTILVSATTPDGEPGDEPSFEAILVGSDGCEVAFESASTNLYPQASASAPQVYLRDLCSTPPSTTLISRADGENGDPAGPSSPETPPFPLGATADGSQILFSAAVEGLVAGADGVEHLYVRDLHTGHTTLLDRASEADGAIANRELANGGFESATISANGCRASFATPATNLGFAPPGENVPEVYVRQLSPCQPPAQEENRQDQDAGKGNTPPGPGDPGRTTESTTKPPAHATTGRGASSRPQLTVEHLGPRRLLLKLTKSGEVTVRIARYAGRRRHRHWRTIKTIVKRVEAGHVGIVLPHLPAGRYRVSIRLARGKIHLRSLTV